MTAEVDNPTRLLVAVDDVVVDSYGTMNRNDSNIDDNDGMMNRIDQYDNDHRSQTQVRGYYQHDHRLQRQQQQQHHHQFQQQRSLPRRTRSSSSSSTTTTTTVEVYNKRTSFIHEFFCNNKQGGWQIILIGFLTAVGLGSVLGVIPQITTQRYAEELYGYNTNSYVVDGTDNDESSSQQPLPPCNSFGNNINTMNNDDDNNYDAVPEECILGANYAQSAASITTFTRNILALLLNGIAGSYSDIHGRRSKFLGWLGFGRSFCLFV